MTIPFSLRSRVLIVAVLGLADPAQGRAQDPSPASLEVYRITLNILFFSDYAKSIGGHAYTKPQLIVVQDSTAFAHGTDLPPDSLRGLLQFEFPAASLAVIDDLLMISRTSDRPILPPLPVRTVLVGARDVSSLFPNCAQGWRQFRSRFPGSQGLLQVSRVAFDADSTQALVYVGNQRDCLDGFGMLFYLEHRSEGWKLIAHQILWVS